jgi:hypothetical protein
VILCERIFEPREVLYADSCFRDQGHEQLQTGNGRSESMNSKTSETHAAASNEEIYSWSEEDDDFDNQTIASSSSTSRRLSPSSSFSQKAGGDAVESSAAKSASPSLSTIDPMQMRGLPRLDILCGRGKPIQDHPGNKRMHMIIQWHKQRYLTAGRGRKKTIIMEVLEQVKQRGTTTKESSAVSNSISSSSTSVEEHHRFLFRCQTAPGVFDWQEANEAMAIKKVAHGLRGKPPTPVAGGPTFGKEDNRRTTPKFESLPQDFDPDQPRWSPMLPIHQSDCFTIQSGHGGVPLEQKQHQQQYRTKDFPPVDKSLTVDRPTRQEAPPCFDDRKQAASSSFLSTRTTTSTRPWDGGTHTVLDPDGEAAVTLPRRRAMSQSGVCPSVMLGITRAPLGQHPKSDSPPTLSSRLLHYQQEQQHKKQQENQQNSALLSLKSSFSTLLAAPDGNHSSSNRQSAPARLWVDGATTSTTMSSSQVDRATNFPGDPMLDHDPKLEGQNSGDKEDFSSCETMFDDPGECPPSPSIF